MGRESVEMVQRSDWSLAPLICPHSEGVSQRLLEPFLGEYACSFCNAVSPLLYELESYLKVFASCMTI